MTAFDRLGRFCARRRWWVVAVWALLALVAVPLAPRAPGALQPGGFSLDDLEAARARHLLESTHRAADVGAHHRRAGGRRPAGGRPGLRGGRRSCAGRRAERRARHRDAESHPRHEPGQRRSARPCTRWSRSTSPRTRRRTPSRRSRRRSCPSPGSASRSPVARRSTATSRPSSEQDLQRSELISLPLAALALLIVFGSVVAAGRARRRRRRGGAGGAGGHLRSRHRSRR